MSDPGPDRVGEVEAPGEVASKVFDKLAAQDAERRRGAERRKEEAREQQDPRESIDALLAATQRHRAEWQDACLASGGLSSEDAKRRLEALAVELKEMEAEVAEASYFLPAYEQRSAAAAHRQMHQQLEEARANLFPKNKFSFGSGRVARKKAAEVVSSAASVPPASSSPSGSAQEPEPPQLLHGRGIQGLRDCTVVVGPEALGGIDYTLMDLKGCNIFLLGKMSALRCHRLACCRVHSGPVAGSTFLDAIDGCVFHLSSHQVRIHSTTDSDLYLRVRSNPIIEHSKGLRVAPATFEWPGGGALLREAGLASDDPQVSGKWRQVDDFGWLRAVQSPNWCILPEGQRTPPDSPPGNVEYGKDGTSIVSGTQERH